MASLLAHGKQSAPASIFLVDVEDVYMKVQSLIFSARALSQKEFTDRFYVRDLAGHGGPFHLTLLVDPGCSETLAFCYYLLPSEGFLWVEQIAVSEKLRGRGLGRKMMGWAVERAQQAGCWAVRLSALMHAVPFYRAIGFQDRYQGCGLCSSLPSHTASAAGGNSVQGHPGDPGWPMQLLLQEPDCLSRGQLAGGFWPQELLSRNDSWLEKKNQD